MFRFVVPDVCIVLFPHIDGKLGKYRTKRSEGKPFFAEKVKENVEASLDSPADNTSLPASSDEPLSPRYYFFWSSFVTSNLWFPVAEICILFPACESLKKQRPVGEGVLVVAGRGGGWGVGYSNEFSVGVCLTMT